MMINLLLIILLEIHGAISIDNGFPGQQEQFNYLVSVQRFGKHLCSGTIIHESHILTVGHVIRDVFELIVAGGLTVRLYPNFAPFLIKDIYYDFNFNQSSYVPRPLDEYWENDIAILRLETKISRTFFYQPIRLIDRELDWHSCPAFGCKISSWQRSESNDQTSISIMWSIVDILSIHTCREYNIVLLENQMCFADPLRTAIISSDDLGSPIVCDEIMVGITVQTENPAIPLMPSTFLSIFPYSDFIADTINNGEFYAEPEEFPYVVSIWHRGDCVCGGTILDATHILTARHCFEKKHITRFRVVVGSNVSTTLLVPYPSFGIKKIQPHWLYKRFHVQFTGGLRANDIAVITLTEEIPSVPAEDYVKLASSDTTSPGDHCQVLHWERLTRENEAWVRLKKSRIILLDKKSCGELGVTLHSNQFCARSPYLVPIGNVLDSGNPIICGGIQMGFIVNVFTENPSSAPVLISLKIPSYLTFIERSRRTK